MPKYEEEDVVDVERDFLGKNEKSVEVRKTTTLY
jgi:hypothetical protein